MSERTFLSPEQGIAALVLSKEAPAGVTLPIPSAIGEYPGLTLAGRMPYLSLEVIDGDQSYFEDEPLVEANAFTGSWSASESLLNHISLTLMGYPRSVTLGSRRFIIDSCRVIQRPRREDWDDDKVRRMSAIYQLSIRR
jgi:hypothetical protein